MHTKTRTAWGKWLLALLGLAGLVYVFTKFPIGDWLKTQLEGIQSLGTIGYLWFIALYIVATVAGFPASILTLGAGAVFGILTGSVLVVFGATLGSTAAFLVGRYVARGAVAKRVESNAKFRAVDEAVGRAGFKIVLMTRLSPVFPFVLLNYAYGITKVRLSDYFFASLIGMIPGTVLYVYLGSLAASVATGELPDSPARKIFTVVGLLLTIAVTVYVTKIARSALREVEGATR